jgi:hypothetical protein
VAVRSDRPGAAPSYRWRSPGPVGGWTPTALASETRESIKGEDLFMDHVIDLDQAAAEITARLLAWTARAQPWTDHLAR